MNIPYRTRFALKRFFTGLLIVLTGFIGGVWVFLPITFLMVLAPIIYSYILHQKGL